MEPMVAVAVQTECPIEDASGGPRMSGLDAVTPLYELHQTLQGAPHSGYLALRCPKEERLYNVW